MWNTTQVEKKTNYVSMCRNTIKLKELCQDMWNNTTKLKKQKTKKHVRMCRIKTTQLKETTSGYVE